MQSWWRKLAVLLALVLALSVMAACSSSGDTPDGDSDGDTPDGDCDLLPLGGICAGNPDCCSGLCYPETSGSFCSTTCSSDTECAEQLGGACCQQSPTGQNICYPAHLCGAVDGDPDGDEPDGDATVICTPDETVCQNRSVVKCNSAGTAWAFDHECTEDQSCQLGECIGGSDGDVDGDTADGDQPDGDEDGEEDYGCRPPQAKPGSSLNRAELVLEPEDSNPEDAAEIYETENDQFTDGTYVRLYLPGRDSGPLDENDNVQELVFFLDIDQSYMYTILVDYVCGVDFGEVEVYLDNGTEPLLRIPDSDPIDYLSLHCTPSSGYPEQPLKLVGYAPICIEEGEHLLRMRVRGKTSASNGYTLGVDYISVVPDFDDDVIPGATK